MPLDPHAAALGLLLRSGPNMLELNWLLAKGYSPHEALTKLLNGFGRPRELLTDRETAEVAKFERELARGATAELADRRKQNKDMNTPNDRRLWFLGSILLVASTCPITCSLQGAFGDGDASMYGPRVLAFVAFPLVAGAAIVLATKLKRGS